MWKSVTEQQTRFQSGGKKDILILIFKGKRENYNIRETKFENRVEHFI